MYNLVDIRNSFRYLSVKIPIPIIFAAVFMLSSGCDSTETQPTHFGLISYQGCDYSTVQIGDQSWFAENLRSEYYRNADKILHVQDDKPWSEAQEGMRCAFNNDDAMAEVYGQLYNGYAVLDERGLCPLGWHVPSDDDWTDLVAFLSEGAEGIQVEGWNGMADWEVGQMLKSNCCWMPPHLSSVEGLSAQDEYGFTALPAGERGFRGFFSGAENYGSGKWWTASTIEYAETRQNEIRYRYLDFRDSELHQASAMKTRGFSVRCVRD